ncbi:hypothetical protein AB0C61_25590 [Streptomyces sp. NPDC048680]|uniref:hypothetical protein n=1 Tax=Streptomyces sp. NPDC048680 TaxID=3155492 RepID=UPI00341E8447
MNTELAALAASGATTLVSLMVTDSWTQVRELVGRLVAHPASGSETVAGLDTARARLLASHTDDDGGARTTREVTDQWHLRLQHLLQTGAVTSDGVRDLLTSLQRIAGPPGAGHVSVHNDISGGTQHGPVIQSGRITGLTVHNPDQTAPGQP